MQVYIKFWVQVVWEKISFIPQSYCRMFSRDNDRCKTLVHFRYDLSSAVWFFLREVNRFLDIFSSFCIFEKVLFLDPRDSILETRSSIVSSIEARGSSFEFRVSSVDLLLSGTVNTHSFARCFWGGMVCRRHVKPIQWQSCVNKAACIKASLPQEKKDKHVLVRLRVGPYREKLWPWAWKKLKNCDLGQHFQDLGHSFSLYGPPSWPITYISFPQKLNYWLWRGRHFGTCESLGTSPVKMSQALHDLSITSICFNFLYFQRKVNTVKTPEMCLYLDLSRMLCNYFCGTCSLF